MNYQNRNEIEENYKWDLSDLFKNNEEWEKEFKKVKKNVSNITKYKGKLLESPENLHEALETFFKTYNEILKLYVYAHTKFDEDLGNTENGLLVEKVNGLFSVYMQNSSYIDPEILKGSKTVLNKIFKNKKLSKYQFYLTDLLRQKEHTLNENEELIIAKLTEGVEAFERINSVLTNSTLDYGKLLVDGEEVTLTNSNYRNIMTNKDRNTRKECYSLLTKKLEEFEDIFASSLIAYMKTENNIASIRGFKNLLEMNLFSGNIPKNVYTNLYKTIEGRLDVYHKYYKMIKTALSLEKISYYDLHAEIVSSTLSFSIDEARLIIEQSLSILGDEYLHIIRKAFDEKWIDFGTYKGKAAGAYCISNYGNHPYVLTNFYGKFTDISTIAHELGHAVNGYLSMKKNHIHDYYGGLFLAEIASLTNEVLLSYYIINNSQDKNLKLSAIYNLLDTIQNNLFDACLEGKLEHLVYTNLDYGEEPSVAMLKENLYRIRTEYYGKEIELDEHIKILWARRSHYFSPYYLYKYATGISAAIYIASKIIRGEDNMKEKYLEFLTKGGTNYPTEILKDIGVDMSKPKTVNAAIDFMDYLIDEFNKISEE